MFKITTLFFMVVSAIFAGLYYTETQHSEERTVYIEVPAKQEVKIVERVIHKEIPAKNEGRSKAQAATKVIIRQVNPFRVLTKKRPISSWR